MLNKLIILVFGIVSYGSFGQEYENYTNKDGLPSNHIYHTIQDSKGFMWFATNRGIAKFDGVKFKVFTTKDGLPNNDIWRITADDKGRVWWNTKSKYQGYIENDSIYKFMKTDKSVIAQTFYRADYNKIIFYDDKSIHLLQNDSFRALQKHTDFEKARLKLKGLSQKHKIKEPRRRSLIYDFRTNELILNSQEKILFYDSNFIFISEIQINSSRSNKYSVTRPFSVGYLPNFSVFMSDYSGTLFINSKEKKGIYYSSKRLVNKNLFNSVPLCITRGKEIQLSVPGHLFILNQEFEIIKKHSFPNFSDNLNSYKDKGGNIWLNNRDKGIVLLANSINYSSQFFKNKRIQKINKIANDIVVGEPYKGIHTINSSQNKFSFKQDLRIKRNIYQIKKSKERGAIYVASNPSYITERETVSSLNKLEIQYVDTLNIERSSLTSNFKDIEILSEFIYLILGNELVKVDLKTKKNVSLVMKSGLLTLSQYRGEVYSGGSDGLFLYKNDSLVKVSGSNEILEASVSFSSADKDYLYIGTDGRGVYLYDGEKEIYLKNTDGLVVQKIIRANDKLWIATQEGVKEVSLDFKDLEKSKITDSYYESDGLPQNNTNDIYLEDSLLWIATDIGLSRINTKSPIYKQKTPVVFDFKNDTVTYNYSSNKQITAGFHALNYTNQNYLKYEYRLLPSNKEWITTNSGSINFSGLSPDLYTLEVKVTDQHFNQSVGKQYIQILPAWWQTNWAKAVFFLVIGFFLYSIFKYTQSRIKIAERKKTKLAGLELQALRSQMNPHFVHNSLNAIKYFMQRNESELSEEYLVKFSKLIRLFFDFSRKENITLKEEIQLLTLYLQIEKLRFEEKLSFLFEIDERIDLEDVIIPSMLLQPLVENAVNHGIFHKKGAGTINIVISYIDDNSYEVEIKDDGIGINEAKKIDHYSHENYQSKSSEVIRDRLELLNQSEKWDITYSMVDVSESSEQQGTRVSLIFKQNQ